MASSCSSETESPREAIYESHEAIQEQEPSEPSGSGGEHSEESILADIDKVEDGEW